MQTRLSLLLLVFSFLSAGCQQKPPALLPVLTTPTSPILPTATFSPMLTLSPTSTPPPRPTVTPTPSATPTAAPSPTLASLPTGMPDILLNIGTNDWFWQSCFPEEGNARIWLSHYPYSDFQILLAKDGVDYLYPRWSPSGNQFAYVESIPILVPEGAEIPTSVDEGVSVWVQDQAGNRRRISDVLPRINFGQADTCGPATYVLSPPLWSPDEQKIVFAYADRFRSKIDYYMIDLNTGATHLFDSDSMYGGAYENPVWINSNQLALVSGKNTFKIFDGTGKEVQKIEPPADLLKTIQEPRVYALQLSGEKLLVGFTENKVARKAVWYLLDATSGVWERVLDVSKMNVGFPYAVDSQIVACETHALTVFDEQWQVVGRNSALPALPDECSDSFQFDGFQLFEYEHRIFASYPGATEGNRKRGIWAMVIQRRAPQPELLVDLSNPPETMGWAYTLVIDYSWRIPDR